MGLANVHNCFIVLAESARARTSVIRRAPKKVRRSATTAEDPLATERSNRDQKNRQSRKISKRAVICSQSSTSNASTLNSDSSVVPADNVIKADQRQLLSLSEKSQQHIDSSSNDMYTKKQRILAAISDTTRNPTTSHLPQSSLVAADSTTADSSDIVSAGSGTSLCDNISSSGHPLPPPPISAAAISSLTPQTLGVYNLTSSSNQRADKLSESSVDGCSSGYNSAATIDSNTISPRDTDGQRVLHHSNHVSMNSLPRLSNISNTPTLSSTPTSVVSANPAAKHTVVPSPLTLGSRINPERSSSGSSPLVIDTSKESPLVPYRDPELLKRDAEVRKMAHTPSGPQPAAIPTSRSLPTAAASNLSSLPPQAALPTAAAAAAMLNPQVAQQQFNIQLMQQYQLMEQYHRQLQAIQTLNPLQHLSMMQQQHQLAAAQQQLALGSLYDRQARSGLPANPQWMMMPPFTDKPLLNDLQREHELRALDQKER